MSPKVNAIFQPSRILTVALATLLVWGCASQGRDARAYEPGAVFYEKIVTDLASPSMEGRGVGTAGLDKARDYLVDHWQRIGLRPAFGDSYTQAFDVQLGTEAAEQSLAIRAAGQGTQATAGEDFSALGMSASAAFQGPAVFVGYGIRSDQQAYDSYQDVAADALNGKVAIAFRYEPMTESGKSLFTDRKGRWSPAAGFDDKARLAAEHGAAALLVVDPPWMALSNQGRLRTARNTAGTHAAIPVMHIRMSLLRQMLHDAGRDADATLAQWQNGANLGKLRAVELNGVTLHGNVKLVSPTATAHNIAGVLPGRGALANQVILVGAHYDHLGYGEVGSRSGAHEIHPGADDNASGAAGVVLLAGHFVQQQQALPPDAEARTIIFACFTGEERGLLGSSYLVKHLEDMGISADRIAAMLNMDMIGRIKKNELFVLGTGTGDQWQRLVSRANQTVHFRLTTQEHAPDNSDHAAFVNRRIPSIHFFSGFHQDYHMPSDTAEKINAVDAVRVLRLMEGVIQPLRTEQPRMAFTGDGPADLHAGVAMGADVDPSSSGGGAHLGVMPDYATTEGDQGARVEQVMADTPAAAAGFQPGDLIVRWNDEPVGNVQQLADLLGNASPGDKVQFTVERDGRPVELHAELGDR